jgi:hypothetical protein
MSGITGEPLVDLRERELDITVLARRQRRFQLGSARACANRERLTTRGIGGVSTCFGSFGLGRMNAL